MGGKFVYLPPPWRAGSAFSIYPPPQQVLKKSASVVATPDGVVAKSNLRLGECVSFGF